MTLIDLDAPRTPPRGGWAPGVRPLLAVAAVVGVACIGGEPGALAPAGLSPVCEARTMPPDDASSPALAGETLLIDVKTGRTVAKIRCPSPRSGGGTVGG
ncbi:hypothetical protein [Rugosimonospora africana]|uniref:Uncharacterized protein n=1 Tax=Rugosimonospora africana TaxID=556532 RepID=A0A8J3QNS3_9ACTN|nr:hypothetical protein [Rugosimonospora africana]GIH12995.1 hypothetical protein Raf01_11670 [Rugosimonospora africana]